MKEITFWTLIAIVVSVFTACNHNKNEVVVYTSVDQVFSEPVLRKFEKKTGIKVKAVFDTEETKSTGVLNRIIAEKNNPQCDLFWSGDPIRTVILKNKGISRKYFSPSAKGINTVFGDKDGYWQGFSARARVLVFNKKMLKDFDVPTSIFDLSDTAYKANVAIANPLFGTTTFHIAALFAVLGNKKAKDFMKALKQNKVVVATSNGDVKKRVINGEVFCGITDTDDAFEAKKESEEVDYVFLDRQNGFGTLIIPNTLCLIKNSPNTENAEKLADYLLSAEVETLLAELCAQMPLHKGVVIPDNVPALDNIVPMNVDYDKTAVKLEEIQDFLKNWMENKVAE